MAMATIGRAWHVSSHAVAPRAASRGTGVVGVGPDLEIARAVTFFAYIECPSCGTRHRSQRTWEGGRVRYVYRCKACGHEMAFEAAELRWAFQPSAVEDNDDNEIATMRKAVAIRSS